MGGKSSVNTNLSFLSLFLLIFVDIFKWRYSSSNVSIGMVSAEFWADICQFSSEKMTLVSSTSGQTHIKKHQWFFAFVLTHPCQGPSFPMIIQGFRNKGASLSHRWQAIIQTEKVTAQICQEVDFRAHETQIWLPCSLKFKPILFALHRDSQLGAVYVWSAK